MAAVLPDPAEDSWVDNPNVGHFDPGAKAGQAIFEKNTKGLKEENRITETKKDAQFIRRFLVNKSLALGKFVTRIPIAYDAVRDPTEWGNLLCEYGSIFMNLLQHGAHKHFSKTVATVDPLPVALFTVTSLDLSNVEKYKKLFYSRVDSQVVAELINNIFTDDEYSKLMLKIIYFTFQDSTTGNKRIDGPFLLKLLFDIIDPNVVVVVKFLCQKLEATKLHPYQNDVNDMLTDI